MQNDQFVYFWLNSCSDWSGVVLNGAFAKWKEISSIIWTKVEGFLKEKSRIRRSTIKTLFISFKFSNMAYRVYYITYHIILLFVFK